MIFQQSEALLCTLGEDHIDPASFQGFPDLEKWGKVPPGDGVACKPIFDCNALFVWDLL